MTKTIVWNITQEMHTQDHLFKTEDENPDIMEKLHKDIVEQAKNQGFTGYTTTYRVDGNGQDAIITDIAATSSPHDINNALGCGTCDHLIRELTKLIQ